MALTLEYRGETNVPVEVEGLTPDAMLGKSMAEIERFAIFHGNRKLPLAEMFRLNGNPSDRALRFEGDLSGVHWIGAGMNAGEIQVRGSAGRHVGSEMSGGSIVVEGNVGDWLGAEMKGGAIRVLGSAGDNVGAAYRGSAKGMTGGEILVHGSAGAEIGHSLRRGMIAVGGDAGEAVGFNLIAGTIIVFGACGRRPGAGMKRGTIGLFGPRPAALLPTFQYAATLAPDVLRLLLRSLKERGFPFDSKLESEVFEIYSGDHLEMGRGEILLRTQE